MIIPFLRLLEAVMQAKHLITIIKILRQKRFPIYRLNDPVEAGAVCLQMILAYYGKKFSLRYLVELIPSEPELGVSMLSIYNAAQEVGFKCLGVKLTYDVLKTEVPLPCILHWHDSDFVVLYKIKKKKTGDKIYIANPSYGKRQYSQEIFCHQWYSQKESNQGKGLALLFEPTEKWNTIQER